MGIFEILMVVGVGIVLAVVLALVWAAISRKRTTAQVEETRHAAERILEDANKQAAARVKEADLEAKEKLLQMRSDFDRKSQQSRDEIKAVEKRLDRKSVV